MAHLAIRKDTDHQEVIRDILKHLPDYYILLDKSHPPQECMMKFTYLIFFNLLMFSGVFSQELDEEQLSGLAQEAELSLEKGIAFMHTLAIEGGYVYHYTLDGKEKWGRRKNR
jgi:hypothetical protein